MLLPLNILFGSGVGFALGLTGGGGSLLAVPLLVYGLSIAPREAFAVSLASVGVMALIGAISKIKSSQVEFRAGALFAVAGMSGAPIGIALAGRITETALLTLFAGFMLSVAILMWRKASKTSYRHTSGQQSVRGWICQRAEDGSLLVRPQCTVVLGFVALGSGILSGLFGVGGGFIIVPALVLLTRMPIHRAVGTSLFIIAFVSLSGVFANFAAGRLIALDVTALFVGGGVFGLFLGTRLAIKLPASSLQKSFRYRHSLGCHICREQDPVFMMP